MWTKFLSYKCRHVRGGVAHLVKYYDKDAGDAPPVIRIDGVPFEEGKVYKMSFALQPCTAKEIIGD